MATTNGEGTQRIEELVRQLNDIADRESRETATSLVEAILELHGAGLERIMEILFEGGDAGKAAIRRFARDGLVASLLVLHDLHPDDLETRVQRALGKMHGAAELVSVFEGAVRVRLESNSHRTKESIEVAIREEAPDLLELVIEESLPQLPSNDFIPLKSLGLTSTRTPEHA